MDQLGACRNNGMRLPENIDPRYGLPPELVVYSDPRHEFVGDTLDKAFQAAKAYFGKPPDLIFVVLPERGARSLLGPPDIFRLMTRTKGKCPACHYNGCDMPVRD